MNKCSKKQCLISAIAVFAFIVIFDKLFHTSGYMTKLYEQTATLWRSKEEMMNLMPWMLVRDALLALVITCLFKKFAKGYATCVNANDPKSCCPVKRGMCFGLKLGLLLTLWQAGCYIHMPIPQELAIAWFIGTMVEGLGIGVVLSLLCKKDSGECNVK